MRNFQEGDIVEAYHPREGNWYKTTLLSIKDNTAKVKIGTSILYLHKLSIRPFYWAVTRSISPRFKRVIEYLRSNDDGNFGIYSNAGPLGTLACLSSVYEPVPNNAFHLTLEEWCAFDYDGKQIAKNHKATVGPVTKAIRDKYYQIAAKESEACLFIGKPFRDANPDLNKQLTFTRGDLIGRYNHLADMPAVFTKRAFDVVKQYLEVFKFNDPDTSTVTVAVGHYKTLLSVFGDLKPLEKLTAEQAVGKMPDTVDRFKIVVTVARDSRDIIKIKIPEKKEDSLAAYRWLIAFCEKYPNSFPMTPIKHFVGNKDSFLRINFKP